MNIKKILLATFGLLGVITSYYIFLEWMLRTNSSLLSGWQNANSVDSFGKGFSYDLLFTFFLVILLAFWERKSLGWKRLLVIMLSATIFGVSLGLAFYIYFLYEIKKHPELD